MFAMSATGNLRVSADSIPTDGSTADNGHFTLFLRGHHLDDGDIRCLWSGRERMRMSDLITVD